MAKMTPDITVLKQKRNAEIDSKRIEAYRTESDPLFFKAQRGEIELTEWTSKVEEIKTRFPKV